MNSGGHIILLAAVLSLTVEYSMSSGADVMHEHTNDLIHEASPYLLQHAHNPVDWVPWSEEAFLRAAQDDKPVFLSVGYAACHWCHVMAHESFENDTVAAYLNERFVCIKVDREERPDIDHHYMQAVQQISGRGGWPMSVFLTPDKKPFFGGTYWPPEARYGQPGFMEVLQSIHEYWEENREELLNSAEMIHQALDRQMQMDTARVELDASLFANLIQQSAAHFDSVNGGFGPAPKFPHAMELSMLLREFARTGDPKARNMVEQTLDNMARGGIYDHLGGGFARYSTDERWLVPHFEKMLYDNALLIPVYLDASLAFDRPDFRQTAVECLEWALREMEMPEGGFASSLDADSEGEEGRFYVWTHEEITTVLGAERGARFCRIYGVSEEGNFEQGASILNLAESPRNHTEQLSIELAQDKAALLASREQRVRPGRDEKVLTDWNGLFLSALVRGFAVTGDERYLTSAVKLANRLLTPFENEGKLTHSFLGERRQKSQLLLDYAAFGNGLLDLFMASGEMRWFDGAKGIADQLHELFQNPDGLYFLSADGVAGIQSIDPYDSAMPSGNSVAGNFLAKLYYLTGDNVYRQRAESQIKPIAGFIRQHAPAFAQAELTADLLVFAPAQIVLVDDGARLFWMIANNRYLPRVITLWVNEALTGTLSEDSPLYSLLGGKQIIDGRAAVYICESFTCTMPMISAHEFRAAIEKAATVPVR